MSTALKLPLESSESVAATAPVADIEIARRVSELGDWFHNIDLGGVRTAPNHFLGDLSNVKWKSIAPALPADLSGCAVPDLGCNGGFYPFEMHQRCAARVLGLDLV